MCTRSQPRSRNQCGLTLVELVMFMIIVGVGLTGILLVLNVAVKSSADPMIQKNLLSIAEGLIEEVAAQPFTYCDPGDATWSTATSAQIGAGKCTSIVQGVGPGTTGQVRISTTARFNNVTDYHGASGHGGGSTGLGDATNPILDVGGNATSIPVGYTASISIVPEALSGISSSAPASCTSNPPTDCTLMNAVRVAVTVTNGSNSLTLEGYRARYWPNDTPW